MFYLSPCSFFLHGLMDRRSTCVLQLSYPSCIQIISSCYINMFILSIVLLCCRIIYACRVTHVVYSRFILAFLNRMSVWVVFGLLQVRLILAYCTSIIVSPARFYTKWHVSRAKCFSDKIITIIALSFRPSHVFSFEVGNLHRRILTSLTGGDKL